MITPESELHTAIARHVAARGFAPTMQRLQEQLGWSLPDLERTLKQLAAIRGVILKPDSPDVWAIHPFTLMPTATWVQAETGGWWANCAWCALGIGAALGQDIRVCSRVGAEGAPLEFSVRDGRPSDERLLMHFPFRPSQWWKNPYNPCGGILFFSNAAQIDAWCARHGFPRGDMIGIGIGVTLAKEWFGDSLDPSWRRKTPDEARNVFRSLGLNEEFWCCP